MRKISDGDIGIVQALDGRDDQAVELVQQ